jgi:C4-dicarboxylate-specific signal transduction histidine kinase
MYTYYFQRNINVECSVVGACAIKIEFIVTKQKFQQKELLTLHCLLVIIR